MRKEIEKMLLDLQIIALELVALNTRFYWERFFFNISTNSLKISDTTKAEFFELIFSQSNPKTCCLPISVLTQGFLGI